MGSLSLDNAAAADALERYASLLELAGSSTYAIRAYRRAAELVRTLPTPVAELVASGRVRDLRGIGRSLEARLMELVETGELAHARELELELAPRLAATVREALATGEGEPRSARGLLLDRARELAETIAGAVDGEVAGDPRRWCDVSHRIAVVASSPDAVDRLAGLPQIVAVVARDERGAVGVTYEGVPVELIVAEPATFGTALVRATGSHAFVESLGALPDAPDEEGVFAALRLPFVPPELREGPFAGDEPPALVDLAQIRGDLHVHTTWSDGRASVLEMGEAARALGYEYVAICDHTRSVHVVPGLDADDVRRQAEEIADANALLAPFRVLRGIECDILADGTLDLPDDALAELDWVQASVHAGQRASRDEMTKRVVEALRNPHVSCLSHPKGRMIGRRPENELDLERAFEVALEEAKAVEVNGLASRLDLRDVHVRLALESGVAIVCSTDAHSTRGLANMRLAVATARRGGATAGDVVNTRRLADLL